MERIRNYARFLLFGTLFLFQAGSAFGEILVIYPEAPEPYREAFGQMIAGIARTAAEPLEPKMMTDTAGVAELQALLDTERFRSVVLLGQRALNLYSQVRRVPLQRVFAGGVTASPGQTRLPGISLTIDPGLYLSTLRELLPDVRRLVVFYDAPDESWIAHIKAAAKDIRIEAAMVTDAPDIARKLDETFKNIDPKTSALWFGRNTIARDTELLYPFVLKQAWERRIAVISETIAHVRRGFLFAYYPNYSEIGAELGELVRRQATLESAGFRFARAGQLTLNGRTADHLEIPLPLPVIRRAKPLFPEP